jgi:tRNA(fMet)-specific endonuclease VapC
MSTFRFLLDTNILSDLIRQPAGSVAHHIREHGEGAICTSIIVACELRYGSVKKGSRTLSIKVEQMLTCLEILPLSTGADHHYALLRTRLEQQGTPIGPNDLLIAAHALSFDLTLVTANTQEFSRVPALAVQNWLR